MDKKVPQNHIIIGLKSKGSINNISENENTTIQVLVR